MKTPGNLLCVPKIEQRWDSTCRSQRVGWNGIKESGTLLLEILVKAEVFAPSLLRASNSALLETILLVAIMPSLNVVKLIMMAWRDVFRIFDLDLCPSGTDFDLILMSSL